ncbi:MAG TPA: helix-turn-helix transcriptional regulator [Thermomicrobiales bacterium]|nr:helix-turn-helix transcriptional regulator [Thermomicrobiales bacterium]
MNEEHQGSAFDDFLREDGLYEDVSAAAGMRVVIWQLKQEMEARGMTKSELAERMHTSRSQVDRILNGTGEGVGLDTIERAARAVGRSIRIEMV